MMHMYVTPYRRMSNLRQAMDRLFEENFAETNEREMALAVDVHASDEAYTINALVPGLTAEDLNIEILNNTVTLRGEFKAEAQPEGAHNLMCELPSGRFGRVITLPTAVEAGKAEATIKNGVLTLGLPKAEAHRPKTIKVAVG